MMVQTTSAVNKGPKGNRIMKDNSQIINQIGLCENHR
jgi:hypothetical protein